MPIGVVELGTGYLHVFFAGLPFMALNFTLNNCPYGQRRTNAALFKPLYERAKIAFSYLLTWYRTATGPGVTGPLCRRSSVARPVSPIHRTSKSNRLKLRFLPETSYIPERDRAERMLRIGVPSAMQGLFETAPASSLLNS